MCLMYRLSEIRKYENSEDDKWMRVNVILSCVNRTKFKWDFLIPESTFHVGNT